MSDNLFLGIDAGTGGLRAVVVSEKGDVVASGRAPLECADSIVTQDRHEQNAEAWWRATLSAVGSATAELRDKGFDPAALRAVAVDGTSGTVVSLDAAGKPIGHALMYNDGRSKSEATQLNEVAAEHCAKLGYKFAASYALAKIFWLQKHAPRQFAKTRVFAHQSDFLAGRLTGSIEVTDYSNALKTGFDLREECWPDWLDQYPEVRARLPEVVAPGTRIGKVLPEVARQMGVPPELPVISGATDGTAGFLASGAKNVGDDNTTLGTTLVFKRVADRLATDPAGMIYSHKLPGGRWLPGAASNTGGQWMQQFTEEADPAELDRAAAEVLPVGAVCYPLVGNGERFPFSHGDAHGFCETVTGDVQRYAAHLQGTAFVERLGYEVLDDAVGARAEGPIYATGGGAQSDVWLQLRADVAGRDVHRPACPESAFGAAVLAAAGTIFDDVWIASRQMVRVAATFVPDAERQAAYEPLYARFKALLRENVFLP